jgi:hypothetical protein
MSDPRKTDEVIRRCPWPAHPRTCALLIGPRSSQCGGVAERQPALLSRNDLGLGKSLQRSPTSTDSARSQRPCPTPPALLAAARL